MPARPGGTGMGMGTLALPVNGSMLTWTSLAVWGLDLESLLAEDTCAEALDSLGAGVSFFVVALAVACSVFNSGATAGNVTEGFSAEKQTEQ